MGAVIIESYSKGKSISEAWNDLYESAEDYSGHQSGYSGDFNSCRFTKDLTNRLKYISKEELDEYIEENVPKGEAWGYCVTEPKTNNNKIKSAVHNIVQKGARKWETVYEAMDSYGNVVVSAPTQTECIKKARAYVEKNNTKKLEIIISKRLSSGNHQCAIVEYKKSTNEAPGKYKFIALARC